MAETKHTPGPAQTEWKAEADPVKQAEADTSILRAALERRSATVVRNGRDYTIAPRPSPKVHDLKCAAGYYEAVDLGLKTAELRLNDRDFAPHDILRLHELEYGALTGRTIERRITHIVWDSNGPWLAPGYCMLSLGPIVQGGVE